MIIKPLDLLKIKEFAQDAFKERPSFNGLDGTQMQTYCITVGVQRFLKSKGIDGGFEVEGFIQELSEPVDDTREIS